MKIRNRHLLRIAGWTAAKLARSLVGTLRIEYEALGTSIDPAERDPTKRTFLVCRHEDLLVPAAHFGGADKAAMISAHADGQLLAALLRDKGMGLILGSTTRGGVPALRQMIDPDAPWQHMVFTPDGPRGPRRVVQPGVIFAASKSGIPICPLGVGIQKAWRLNSWDRFAIPKPFCRARMITGEPFYVPSSARKGGLEPYRLALEAELDRLSTLANEWAATGIRPNLTVPAEPLRLAS